MDVWYVCVCVCAVTTTFSCTLKYTVKDCDPSTGEADAEGYQDEYIVSMSDITLSSFHMQVAVRSCCEAVLLVLTLAL